jgi:hypothetical protein
VNILVIFCLVLTIFSVTALNYETATNHVLTIVVHDTLTPVRSTTVTLTVHVTPVNEFAPVFAPATYTAALLESVAAGTR